MVHEVLKAVGGWCGSAMARALVAPSFMGQLDVFEPSLFAPVCGSGAPARASGGVATLRRSPEVSGSAGKTGKG